MRALGVLMEDEPLEELHILLTHLHLDHLQGLGFFRPLFRPGVDVHIWGPASPVQSLADRIAIYLSPPLFPVRLSDIPARLTFHDAPEGEGVTIGSTKVRAAKVAHQGPTVGYRVEENGRSLAYLPDHELSLGGMRIADQPSDWLSGYDLARGVDVLFHDAQYDDDEYPRHVGWGHSCIEDVIAFTRKAGVENLVLFHHDPYHDDEHLEALLGRAQRRWSDGRERICLAQEGMTITLDAARGGLLSS
jgi:ribonuclease BN (tRNA processing enzyme)